MVTFNYIYPVGSISIWVTNRLRLMVKTYSDTFRTISAGKLYLLYIVYLEEETQ